MLKEGKVGPRNGTKQQKVVQDAREKRSRFVDSREEQNRAEMCITWSPRLEVDEIPIPWNALVQEYQRGRAGHIAKALE